jgi:hypothetical protein
MAELRSTRRKPWQADAQWTAPTGDTQRKVRLLTGERTCLECGETFMEGGYCERCSDMRGKLPSVPTATYLHDEEYIKV